MEHQLKASKNGGWSLENCPVDFYYYLMYVFGQIEVFFFNWHIMSKKWSNQDEAQVRSSKCLESFLPCSRMNIVLDWIFLPRPLTSVRELPVKREARIQFIDCPIFLCISWLIMYGMDTMRVRFGILIRVIPYNPISTNLIPIANQRILIYQDPQLATNGTIKRI